MPESPAAPAPAQTRAKALLVQVLALQHSGAANGISAARLAARVGVGERMLRTLVSLAREDGIAIAGTPSTGYYIAETAQELQLCCAFLRSRAMHSLRIEAQLRRQPLADLLGQLRLPT